MIDKLKKYLNNKSDSVEESFESKQKFWEQVKNGTALSFHNFYNNKKYYFAYIKWLFNGGDKA